MLLFDQLEQNTYIKYLGIFFDKNLSWKFHINLISSKISNGVGIIAKLRHYVPRKILFSIYNSLILPYISFGISAWGQAAKRHLDKLLILQKRAVRLIYFFDRRKSAIPLFYSSNISPINVLFTETIACLMYDVHAKRAPSNVCEMFSYVSEQHSYNTRASANKNFYIKHSRKNIQYKSFSRFGSRLWNNIPQTIRSIPKKSF